MGAMLTEAKQRGEGIRLEGPSGLNGATMKRFERRAAEDGSVMPAIPLPTLNTRRMSATYVVTGTVVAATAL